MSRAQQRIPPYILAAGRRGARPGELDELRRLIAARAAQRPGRNSPAAMPGTYASEAFDSQTWERDMERWCTDPRERVNEYTRRVDLLIHDRYRLGAPIDEDHVAKLRESVRRAYLAELQSFLDNHPDIAYRNA